MQRRGRLDEQQGRDQSEDGFHTLDGLTSHNVNAMCMPQVRLSAGRAFRLFASALQTVVAVSQRGKWLAPASSLLWASNWLILVGKCIPKTHLHLCMCALLPTREACATGLQSGGRLTDGGGPSKAIRCVAALLFAVIQTPFAIWAEDLSAPGLFQTAEIDFPELIDRARGGLPEPTPYVRGPIRRMIAERSADKFAMGRKVPIKMHCPEGATKIPIIVLSHGAGGDWDTHYAQARHLASHGYAVLSLEHVGSNRARMAQGFRPMQNLEAMIHDAGEVFARPRDVSFAIDCAEEWNRTHEKLRGRLDLQRVGVMGHSFGAFTTMVVCGMRPALEWLKPRVEPGRGLGPELRDSRVKCGVALSPQGVGEPFFIRESFGSLKVPLLGISGTQDRQQNGLPAVNRREAFALWPPGSHKFIWLADATHLDFTDSTGASRRALPAPTRADVQPVVRAATVLFFNAHLKSDIKSEKQLSSDALNPYLRGAVHSVDVLAKSGAPHNP